MLLVLVLVLGGRPAAADEGWVPKGTAELILLDKVRAQPMPVSVKVGASTVFGSITVTVRSCFTRPPDQATESTGFIEVNDSRGTGDVFRGWLFANAPSVSVMEHPVYDVRLAACR